MAQPADVVLQRPFKHGITQRHCAWAAAEITKQLQAGKVVKEIKVPDGVRLLRQNAVAYMYSSWVDLKARKEMIVKGWKACGILQAWDSDTISKAKDLHLSNELFPAGAANGAVPSNADLDGTDQEPISYSDAVAVVDPELSLDEVLDSVTTEKEEVLDVE